MDKELPWLADNAQLELKYKKGKTPLSHRNWPGEPVPVITESIIQTLGDARRNRPTRGAGICN